MRNCLKFQTVAFSTFAIPIPKLPEIKIRKTQAYIDGEWIDGRKTFTTYNPATATPLAEVFSFIYYTSSKILNLIS